MEGKILLEQIGKQEKIIDRFKSGNYTLNFLIVQVFHRLTLEEEKLKQEELNVVPNALKKHKPKKS